MRNLQTEQRDNSPRKLPWHERGVATLSTLMLLAGAFLFCLGGYEFGFGGKWDVASRGLDWMSDGILVALIGVMAYVCYSAIRLLLINLFDEKRASERA
jgi:hypothetical protein